MSRDIELQGEERLVKGARRIVRRGGAVNTRPNGAISTGLNDLEEAVSLLEGALVGLIEDLYPALSPDSEGATCPYGAEAGQLRCEIGERIASYARRIHRACADVSNARARLEL